MGSSKGYLTQILHHFCPCIWLREAEALLEVVLGIIKQIHQETDLHFDCWRVYTASVCVHSVSHF